jgi:hypothetical protein
VLSFANIKVVGIRSIKSVELDSQYLGVAKLKVLAGASVPKL